MSNRLLSIVLVLAAMLASSACNKDDQAPTTSDPAQGSGADEQIEADAPDEAEVAGSGRTVVRTDNPDDVKLATDVLMAFVTSDQVDARHFSVTVSEGVAHLTPVEDATDDEQSQAAALAQTISGIESVEIAGSAAPHVVAENAEAVEEAIAAQNSPATDDGPSAEEEQQAAEAIAEPENAPEDEADDGAQAEPEPEDEPEAATPPAQTGDFRSYTIKRGDTLSVVAARELGSGGRWNEIYELNRDVIGSNPDGIRDGMVIRLPVE